VVGWLGGSECVRVCVFVFCFFFFFSSSSSFFFFLMIMMIMIMITIMIKRRRRKKKMMMMMMLMSMVHMFPGMRVQRCLGGKPMLMNEYGGTAEASSKVKSRRGGRGAGQITIGDGVGQAFCSTFSG
jgi:hypothetical protein